MLILFRSEMAFDGYFFSELQKCLQLALLQKVYLIIISLARIRPKTEWAIDSEAMRVRGIIVLVKSN